MNSTLKAAGHIGAELGAAKAENARLRGLLRDALNDLQDWKQSFQDANHEPTDKLLARIDAALSRQAEPTDTYTATDMATAAAQGFRDGQAAVEQAPAQDELWAVHAQGPDELYAAFSREDAEQHAAALNTLSMPAGIQVSAIVVESPWPAAEHWKYLAEQERDHVTELRARVTRPRPAQTEQQPTVKDCLTVQPIAYAVFADNGNVACFSTQREHPSLVAFEADGHSVVSLAPIAQTAPQPEQSEQHERWTAMSGDWRETSVAIHGERSGYIACGIPEDKAHAIIKAHNIGLPEDCAASPAMDAKEE